MFDSKYLAKILFLSGFLSFSTFAETSLKPFNTFSYQNSGSENQIISNGKINNKHFITNQAKTAKVKFGMVFTPEDLTTVPYKNFRTKSDESQIVVTENSERIIGFYIQSYF